MLLERAPLREIRDFYCDTRHWERYKARSGDVVIATAPKVGTTWTQQIVSLLIFQNTEPRPLMMMSPWLDARAQMPLDVMLDILEGQDHRRSIKSHLPLDGLPIYDEVRYIHVARGGRDACMSFLNHVNAYTPFVWGALDAVGMGDPEIGFAKPRPPRDAVGFFRHWITSTPTNRREVMADAFFAMERSFWAARGRENVLLVHYNDLKADLSGEMARIAAFLGIETPADLWPNLVEAATFEAMKRAGEAHLPGIEMAFEGGASTFLNKGTNNRWQGVLTDDENTLYLKRLAEETTPALAAWLEGGRAVAGDPRTAPD